MSNLLDFLAQFGYPILFLLNILETAVVFGFVLPADTLLVTSGFLAHLGVFNLKISILISFLGAVIGDNIAYYTGSKYGRKILKKHGRFFGIKKKHFDYTKSFFKHHGNKSVFAARFIGYIRSFVPLFAGINHMRYRSFLFYQVTGAFFWAVSFNLIGFYFGKHWELIHAKVKIIGETSAIILVIILIIFYFYRNWKKGKKLSR